ncbi:hypothetical protein EH244_18365 [Variovorax beijingensis]|uniref:Mannose-6-phosphate isomerase type II C-terminal domain-containing protein n=1 Tax=Variovorax beijingensis TaxID=2496117 RepID=A0A3P3EL72_9BURK|nr:hypothetical protein EH244_18365 [Variovorax beijingensis]
MSCIFGGAESRPWLASQQATSRPFLGKVEDLAHVLSSAAELSLQYHHQRAAHWAGVQGRDLGQISNIQHGIPSRRISLYPLKEKHRLTNIGNEELALIEAQGREYPGANDFIRLANTCRRI